MTLQNFFTDKIVKIQATMSTSVPNKVQLTLILKKHNLDQSTLNHYWPISNLPYLSKLVERAVAQKLSNYMADSNLFETLQPTYCKAHSTETAIIYIC